MVRGWPALPFAVLLLLLAGGCAKNPYVLQGEVTNLKSENERLLAQNQQLRDTADALNEDNLKLDELLARDRRQSQLLEDEVVALRDQLQIAQSQMAKLKDEVEEASRVASANPSPAADRDLPGPRPQATITANSSLKNNIPKFDIPGVEVRFDGDVVRIELPTDQLFPPGDAQLAREGGPLVSEIAQEVARRYPDQRIGVEGHTDSHPLPRGSRYTSNHTLSVAQATTVLDYILSTNTRLRPQQTFIVGHGSTQPVVSNGTPEGQARNRRVEIVIYPESLGP